MRELRNAVERAVLLSEGTRIEAIDDRNLATVKLPVGRSTLVLTAPGAEAVTPHEQRRDCEHRSYVCIEAEH